MDYLEKGKPNCFKAVEVKVPNDEFENMIRKFGITNSCEYFGHSYDSEFTKETIAHFAEKEELVKETCHWACSGCELCMSNWPPKHTALGYF